VIETDELQPQERTDFRRANGAPMWIDKQGKNQRGSRPSGWGKELDDENALVNWKIDRAIEGVAKDETVRAAALALKADDRTGWSAAREKAIAAGRGNTRADIGTALHAMSQRWEEDDHYDPGPPYTASLEAYSAEMSRLGLISQRFEFQIVNEEYRAAGTADRLYELTRPLVTPSGVVLPPGELVIGDLKTGAKFEFSAPGYAIQLAIYAQGEFYDVANDAFMPTPDINQDWGLLVHMPAGEGVCTFHWCDLDAGNYGAWMVREIRDWRRKWNSGDYCSPPVEIAATIPDPEPLQADDEPEPERDWLAWGNERLRVIGEHPEARKWAVTWWPDELPKPRELRSPGHVLAFLDFLDRVEAEFEIPFPGPDPRAKLNGHRSTIPSREEAILGG
jgi:hypothetical protein